MSEQRRFAKGDRVRHRQCPSLHGTVVRYFKPSSWPNGMVFWKGHDPFNPEKLDWTWDHAMEKVVEDGHE